MPTGSSGKVQSVQVTELPPVTEATAIPRSIKEFFLGRGMRVSLCSGSNNEIKRRARYQIRQMAVTDIPEANRKALLEVLANSGFREIGGFFYLGDTSLFLQPQGEFEAMGFRAFDAWKQTQWNGDTAAAELFDSVDGNVRHGVRVMSRERAEAPGRDPNLEVINP